jgi:hypothetical protein
LEEVLELHLVVQEVLGMLTLQMRRLAELLAHQRVEAAHLTLLAQVAQVAQVDLVQVEAAAARHQTGLYLAQVAQVAQDTQSSQHTFTNN